jgi:gliding motility-associated lipoprotein GldJ
MLKNSLKFALMACLAGAALLFAPSCKKPVDSATGWKYNDPKWGGFENHPYKGQETGPGLVLIEGGRFTMGQVEQNVTYDWDNVPRTVSVSSFYMDETEVTNINYVAYLAWLQKVYGSEMPDVVHRALPDTNVWRDELAYNEPYVEYYLRYPSYKYYPVVGVTWKQATEFCKWRTDRVNEYILVRDGVIRLNTQQTPDQNFNTETYLVGKYQPTVRKNLKDYTPGGQGTRQVRKEDGITLPEYRLPTEAEWEYAALALVGNNPYPNDAKKKRQNGEELITDRRIYPWNNNTLRNDVHGNWQGAFLANFKRERGDMMGISGGLNDNADITAPVYSNFPNDFGLYNMAGNVSEWVMDVYRPLSSYDVTDFNSFRGNQFLKKQRSDDGELMDPDSLGKMRYVPVDPKDKDMVNRRNYKRSDNINYLDGDTASDATYNFSVSSLINDHSRVYKGGSWADRAYYLSPGTRRFLDEDQASSTIGFRCAMARLGSPEGNQFKSGKYFQNKRTQHNKSYKKLVY